MRGERFIVGLILATIFGSLVLHAPQPIVENYVGRQIPTAMVARNLDQGSGFFHPMLDTGPFPNQFLVEPPIYAQMVVGVKYAVGFVWEEVLGYRVGFVWEIAGRLTSAIVLTLGAWSFYGLVRRREGVGVALVALASFGIMPVTLRFGRAFQPDAALLGFVLLGLRGWDAFEASGNRWTALWGGLALAVALALKITAAWVLIPYFLLTNRLRGWVRVAVGVAMLLPALAWYCYAWTELRGDPAAGGGSLASLATAGVWLQALAPSSWVRFATWEAIVRNLVVRAFTPLGFVLAVAGWTIFRPRSTRDRLWVGWGLGVGLAIVALAAKWHHGYYWLVVAPLAALGVARTLRAVERSGWAGRLAAPVLGVLLVGLSGWQAASTWRTPIEWEAAPLIAERIPIIPNWVLVAPEAVLYYAERGGFRLEFSPEAVRRATGEWGTPIPLDQATADPMALVDFYERQVQGGLTVGQPALSKMIAASQSRRIMVIDVGPVGGDPRRSAWRAALRNRPQAKIWTDLPTLIMVELQAGSGTCPVVTVPDDADSNPQLRPLGTYLPQL